MKERNQQAALFLPSFSQRVMISHAIPLRRAAGADARQVMEVRGGKRDRFTVRFVAASQTASRPRVPPLGHFFASKREPILPLAGWLYPQSLGAFWS